MVENQMTEKSPFCFMQLKNKSCVKNSLDPKFKDDYRCDQCLWRIHQSDPASLARLEKLYLRFQQKQ